MFTAWGRLELKPSPSPTGLVTLLLATLMLVRAQPVHPATLTWDGGGDGAAWADSLNWSPDALPTASDSVLIDSTFTVVASASGLVARRLRCDGALQLTAGDLTLLETSIVNDLSISDLSARLTVTGDLTIVNSLSWSAGTMNGSGTTTVSAGAVATLSSGTIKWLDGRTLVNAGTVALAGSQFKLINGAIIDNLGIGIIDVQGDFNVNHFGDAASTVFFSNAGTLKKTAGNGQTRIIATLDNSGTVEGQTGIVDIAGPTVSSGTFDFSVGTTLRFSFGGTRIFHPSSVINAETLEVLNVSMTVSGAYDATTTIIEGALAFTEDDTLTNLTLQNNGGLSAAGDLTITGTTTWTFGSLSGSGRTIFAPGSVATLSGGDIDFLEHTVDNAGTIIWASSSGLSLSGTVFNNLSSGIFEIQSDETMAQVDFDSLLAGTFNNAGTFRKSVATGLTRILVGFNNSGSVEGQTGTVSFERALSSTGSFDFAPGTTLRFVDQHPQFFAAGSSLKADTLWVFSRPTVTIEGNYDVATTKIFDMGFGGGELSITHADTLTNLILDGGTLTTTGDLSITGSTNWTRGTMSGTGTTIFEPSAVVTLVEGTLAARNIQNNGTFTWSGGTFQLNDGATFDNLALGVFDAQGDDSLVAVSGVGAFNNAGIYRRSIGTGISALTVPFTNTASIEVQSGTLWLSDSLPNYDANVLTGGVYDIAGTLQFPGASVTANAATIILDGPAAMIRDLAGSDALANFTTNQSNGALTVRNGRNFSVTSLQNAGAIVVEADTLTITGNYTQSLGTTTLNGGTLAVGGTVDIQGGAAGGTGTFVGNVTNHAELAPGLSPGTTVVAGDYSQPSNGKLTIEVGGFGSDRMQVTGHAALAGTLSVVVDQITFDDGDAFEILTYASRTGVFTALDLDALFGGLMWSLDYGDTSLTMTAEGFFNALGVRTDDLIARDVQNGLRRTLGSIAEAELAANFWLSTQPGDSLIYVVDDQADLYRIDQRTLSVIDVTGLALSGISGLAVQPYTSMEPQATISLGESLSVVKLSEPDLGKLAFRAPLTFNPPTPGARIDLLAYSPVGALYGLEALGVGLGSRLWRIADDDSAHFVGSVPTIDDADDMAFLGGELWVECLSGSFCHLSLSDASILNQAAEPQGGDGIASRLCTTPSAELIVEDNPFDGGGRIRLDWTAYVPPSGVVRYDIYRAQDQCEHARTISNATLAGSVPGGTQQFVDSLGADYEIQFYRIDVIISVAKPSKSAHRDGFIMADQVAGQLFSAQGWAAPNIVINEFAPSGGVPKPGIARIGEMIEIRNLSPEPIDLTGFRLSNGSATELLSGIVPANGFLVHILGMISLPDLGGTLELLPPKGTNFVIDSVSYGTEGGAPTVPTGFTISRVDNTDATDPDVFSFGASSATPDAANEVAAPNLGGSLVMNEVYYLGSTGADYVELYNPLGGMVVLERFALSDGPGFLDSLTAGVDLEPGEVVAVTDTTAGDPFNEDLGESSDFVYLYQFTTDNLLQLVDQIGWGGRLEDSLAAIPEPDTLGGDILTGNVALVRDPDGAAIYTGNRGANWFESGGGVTLRYGLRSPGSPNAPAVTTIQVDPGGGGEALTIGEALALAAAGPKPSVVLVEPGLYDESLTLVDSVSVIGTGAGVLDVLIRGEGGNTILTGSNLSSETRISRVTIRGGHTASDGPFATAPASGAGLRLVDSYAEFDNVRFEFNVAKQNGGAVAVEGGIPRFKGCVFIENHASGSGGAVWVLSGQPRFERCLFVGNESRNYGAAFYLEGGVTLVQNGVLDGNTAWGQQAGIVHATADATVQVSLSMLTNSGAGAALWSSGNSFVNFDCGVIYNHPDTVQTGTGQLSITNVLDADPQYCDPGALIYSYSATSPVVPFFLDGCGQATNLGIAGPPCAPTPTAVPTQVAPRVTQLLLPVPNPFNPQTTLSWDLSRSGLVDLDVYDVRGRRVTRLLHRNPLAAGRHEIVWAGLDDRGRRVASGIYLARLRVDGKVVKPTRRLMLLK